MALHVILGYPDTEKATLPVPLYAGPDLTAGRAIMDADRAHVRYEIINNPRVRRKVSENFAPPAPATVAAPLEIPESLTDPAPTSPPAKKPK